MKVDESTTLRVGHSQSQGSYQLFVWLWYGSGMVNAVADKVTFTLDHATVQRLEEAARRLSMPKSRVVREAIAEYSERIGLLSERERREKLQVFDALVPLIPTRQPGAAQRELKAIREARRAGGRRSLSAEMRKSG
jgi:hypothetical protein